jgi:hypothetical protein
MRSASGRSASSPLSFRALCYSLIPSVDQRDNIFHAPKLVGDAGGHRGRDFQRLMDAAEIVEHEIKRKRVTVVFQLFCEGVCEPGKPAHSRPRAPAPRSGILAVLGGGRLVASGPARQLTLRLA